MKDFEHRRYATMRRRVFDRDQGICARCGLDCHVRLADLLKLRESNPPLFQLRAQVWEQVRIKARKPLWDADHRIEVREGGGACGMENYQTLCGACHVAKTKGTNARLRGGRPTLKDRARKARHDRYEWKREVLKERLKRMRTK